MKPEIGRQLARADRIYEVSKIRPPVLDVSAEVFDRLLVEMTLEARAQNREFAVEPKLSRFSGELRINGISFVRVPMAS